MAKWRDEKKRYRRYQARRNNLPTGHREAIEAVERYALRTGAATAHNVVPILEALVDVFERSVAEGTSVAEVTGGDPVSFAEAVLREYPSDPGSWVNREQERLADTVSRATTADRARSEGAR